METQQQGLAGAPAQIIDSEGVPRFGTYRGEPEQVCYDGLAGAFAASAWKRRFRHKRWQFAAVANTQLLFACGIVELGFASHGFAYLVEPAAGRFHFRRSALGLPGIARVGDRPGEGLMASYRTPWLHLACTRPRGDSVYGLAVRAGLWRGLRAELGLESASCPGLSVVAPTERDGLANFTLKRAGMAATGNLRLASARHQLADWVGGMDYSSGLLDRHTRWRWALVLGRLPDGRRLGLNLVEGFNQGPRSNENGAWLDGTLVPLPRVAFWRRKQGSGDSWQLRSADGAVELEFRAALEHVESRDLFLIASHFQQQIGHFHGRLRLAGEDLELHGLLGVVEDQDTHW